MNPLSLIKRELYRFCWTMLAPQACQHGYEMLISWEKEIGFFPEKGIPFPSFEEFSEMLLEQMAIEGKL